MTVIIELISPSFLAKGNVRNLLNTLSFQGVMLAGIAILLMSGNIDLSAGGVAALCTLVFALILKASPGIPWIVPFIVALLVGAACGLMNVFFMNVINLMPFIVTIGTSSIFGGIAVVITRANAVPINRPDFTNIGTVAIGKLVPVVFLFMVVVVLIHTFVLYKTRFGRGVYMIGGNPLAARLCGLNIKKTRAYLYVSNGIMSAIGGLIWTCLRSQSNPQGFITAAPAMTALIATLLGGVSFVGGAGGMGGAAIGLVIYNVFTTGLIALDIPAYITKALPGVLLILALYMDNFNAMRMRRVLVAAAVKNVGKNKAA